MFPFQLFSLLVFSPGPSESALHCKKGLFIFAGLWSGLPWKEGIGSVRLQTCLVRAEQGRKGEPERPAQAKWFGMPHGVTGGCRRKSVTPPQPFRGGDWRMKRASEKQSPNATKCNSFQNARNLMTRGYLYKTASQTPPYFAIRHPRLADFPATYFSPQRPS